MRRREPPVLRDLGKVERTRITIRRATGDGTVSLTCLVQLREALPVARPKIGRVSSFCQRPGSTSVADQISNQSLEFVAAPALAPPEVQVDQALIAKYEEELKQAAANPLPDEVSFPPSVLCDIGGLADTRAGRPRSLDVFMSNVVFTKWWILQPGRMNMFTRSCVSTRDAMTYMHGMAARWTDCQ